MKQLLSLLHIGFALTVILFTVHLRLDDLSMLDEIHFLSFSCGVLKRLLHPSYKMAYVLNCLEWDLSIRFHFNCLSLKISVTQKTNYNQTDMFKILGRKIFFPETMSLLLLIISRTLLH